MLRKAAFVLAAAAMLALPIVTATDASARYWHHGWHHGYWHHGYRAWAWAPPVFGHGCWRTRRVWTPFGWRWRRVYVCR